MANTEWRIKGVELANCNCATGCPCQFNALPTYGNCRAMTAVRIKQGHFGDIRLDGLCVAITGAWPGPIHMGNGSWQSIVDERADADQRIALEAISTGQHTDPGGSVFQIFNSMVTTRLQTLFKPIDFTLDYAAGTGRVSIPDVLETQGEPIKNPMTGQPHRATVSLPGGFEFTEAEFIAGNTKSSGEISLDFSGTHGHIARVHWSTHGVIR
ncbi:MAG: hypothetical protein JWR16_1632 [Nevskia sp.]|nr:hypothetical protein [Nevskia sp.]